MRVHRWIHLQDGRDLFTVLCKEWMKLANSEERHMESNSSGANIWQDIKRSAEQAMAIPENEIQEAAASLEHGPAQKNGQKGVREWDLICISDTAIRRIPDATCVIDFIESMSSDDLIELELMHNAILRCVLRQ